MQRLFWFGAVFALSFSCGPAAVARPPPGTDVNSFVHRWFGSLHPSGEPTKYCCTAEYDCNETIARRNPDGSWTALYRPRRGDATDERLVTAPKSAEVPLATTLGGINPTSHAVLCATPGVWSDEGFEPTIRCLVPSGPGS